MAKIDNWNICELYYYTSICSVLNHDLKKKKKLNYREVNVSHKTYVSKQHNLSKQKYPFNFCNLTSIKIIGSKHYLSFLKYLYY